jgi:hypothetical protein
MARKPSESQDRVAEFFENVASAVAADGGLFMGDDLSAIEMRAVLSRLRSLSKDFRAQASRNRSINS